MKISTSAAAPATANVDMLAVAVAKPVALEGAVAELDRALGGAIGRLVKAGEIRGAAGQVTVLHTEGQGVRARRVAVVGLGKRATADAESVRNAAGAAVRSLGSVRGRTLAFVLDGLPVDAAEAARCAVDGAVIGSYRFDRFKTSKTADRPKPPTGLVLLSQERAAGAAGRRAAVAADAVNRARDLQHMPPNLLGPEQLAERAREIAAAHPTMRVEVWDEKKIAARGMGAFAAVAQASSRPARLIVLRHTPAQHRPGGSQRGARHGRQGTHLRQRRLLAEAGHRDDRDEVRHVGRRGRAGGVRRDRPAAAAAEVRLGGRRHREHDRHQRHASRRCCHGRQRQDDRDHQHRRRGAAGAGRLPAPRALAWARPTWSTWPR